MANIVALNWSSIIFFSPFKIYTPNTISRLKTLVSSAKFVTVVTIEWTFNQIFGFTENIIIKNPLLITLIQV